jgi:ABC-type sugar transport system permease subunit
VAVNLAETSTGRAQARPVERRRALMRKRAELALLLGPALVLFVGFVLLPIGIAAYYSVHEWNGFGPIDEFVGLDNYTRAFEDPVFRGAIGHNLIIAGLSLLIQLPLSIALALLLNRNLRGRGLLRLVVFAPYVLSEAITAVLWLLMLQPDGFVDQVLRAVGLGGRSSRGWPTATSSSTRCSSSSRGSTWASASSSCSPACRASRGSCARRPRSTAPGRGRRRATSCCRCWGRRSASGSSCR